MDGDQNRELLQVFPSSEEGEFTPSLFDASVSGRSETYGGKEVGQDIECSFKATTKDFDPVVGYEGVVSV
jgi:hypothetical protein